MTLKYVRLVIPFFFLSSSLLAQLKIPTTYGQGLNVITADSTFAMKLGFRFQTLYDGDLNLTTNTWSDGLITRRTRLKFDGYVLSPKIVYKVELSLSNRDAGGGQTPEVNGVTPNIVLDAVVKWKPNSNVELWFGQTKLPGNRERVISSQNLQFVDRSLLNSRFNLDRDLGVQFRYKKQLGNAVIKNILSLSMGEGRNIIIGNHKGYDYTGRVEFLPLGEFSNKGDYFEADLEREESPKLSIAFTADFNDNAVRSRGQLGDFVMDVNGNLMENDLTTLFADAIFKYSGFSSQIEFARRWVDDEQIPFTTGTGLNTQIGYLLKSNYEFVGRFTTVSDDTRFSRILDQRQYTIGASKYLHKHYLKLQTDLTYKERYESGDDNLQYRFQIELAF